MQLTTKDPLQIWKFNLAIMISTASPLLLVTALSWILQPAAVEAGILKGFQKEFPSAHELWRTFELTTRKLLTENDFPTGPRGGVRDASPKIEPTEVSFMIVSLATIAIVQINVIVFFSQPDLLLTFVVDDG
jgi:hypothetical protein